jgi:hypothetical protein
LLDADADRADLELRLTKLLVKDRARVHPFASEADIAQRWSSSQNLWKWIDPYGKEFGI